jgi:hypothetical protein
MNVISCHDDVLDGQYRTEKRSVGVPACWQFVQKREKTDSYPWVAGSFSAPSSYGRQQSTCFIYYCHEYTRHSVFFEEEGDEEEEE